MKSAFALVLVSLFASSAFAAAPAYQPSPALIAKLKAAVKTQLAQDLRLTVSSEFGNGCGLEAQYITLQVEVKKGHRTFDEKTGQVGATSDWQPVDGLTYTITKEAAEKGDYREFWGPQNVCLE